MGSSTDDHECAEHGQEHTEHHGEEALERFAARRTDAESVYKANLIGCISITKGKEKEAEHDRGGGGQDVSGAAHTCDCRVPEVHPRFNWVVWLGGAVVGVAATQA